MTTATQTTSMTRDQIAASGAVLGRAFADDPLFTYILPERTAGREAKLRWFMERGARYGHSYGQVHTTAGNVEGNAVWLPPGDVKLTMPRMARTGIVLAPLKFGLGAFSRFLSAVNEMERLHEEQVPERHWYLMILGVDPARQGQGVGSALLAPGLSRADADGLPCYLETMKERNVPFYQRHGFQVLHEGNLPKGGPYYWTMKRPAGAAATSE